MTTQDKLADALRDIQQYLQMTAPSPDCGHLLQITVDALAEHDAQPAPDECFCDRMYPDSNPNASCGDCPTRDYGAQPAPAPVKPPANGESNEHVALLQELLRAYGDSGFSEERAAFRAAIAALQQKVTTPALPDRHIAVPVVLPALAVSEIKDMLESEYDMYSIQARPLWASLLTIVAKISLDDQIAIDEQARAESYRARLMAKAVPND